ncbi:protein ANTI-SILENCING 1-like isoform X1 [Chenopodium quinoa]|uniref:protein ANTI-SILENCING 1-like isoform X1 n=1 Tax=Chenopodium quinoa TaxID=63459 RepID=UPI000B790BE2|nr:protein ANTI-SILENCING 1-like isoform X1 [Chenopodium quinoa]
MSQLVEENQKTFKWGIKIVTDDSEIKSYKSFTYQGVQYFLQDCVYLYREGAKDTDIGKLVKMWESKTGAKRGKVIWFFRPVDVCNFLREYEPSWNELFLASGEGRGVSNIIPLEAIVGKCNVACTAKDRRNTLLSKSDLAKANYYVSHIFDVGDLRISDKFPDIIDKIKVERLFNWSQNNPKGNLECRTGLSAGAQLKVAEKPTNTAEKPTKIEILHASENFENRDKPKANVECRNDPSANALLKVKEKPTYTAENHIKAEVLSIHENLEHHTLEAPPLKKRKILPVAETDPPSPSQDTRRWFFTLPWEDKVKEAHEQGTLVHLYNLDLSHTALDVQEMISKAFKVKAHAKVIPRRHSFDVYGHALVIFESKDDADLVMCLLKDRCLVVGEGRPLVACKATFNEPDMTLNFPGHLIMDSLKHKFNVNKRKAVFASHCAQANTIEHEMAMQWRMLQNKSDLWWEALYKGQAKEFSHCQNQIMKHRTDELNTSAVEVTVAHESSDVPNRTEVERPSAPKSDEPNRTAVEVTSGPESPVERPQSASHPTLL